MKNENHKRKIQLTLTLAARLSAEAACSVLAMDTFGFVVSAASGKLGVEIDFLFNIVTMALFTSALLAYLLLLSKKRASEIKIFTQHNDRT